MEPQDITLKGEPLRLVVYGAEGVGKTTLALSFPRPLVIDTDDGLISVTYAAGGSVPGTRMTPEGYRNVEDIVHFIRDHLDEYDTIVIDDVSTLCDDLIDELTAEHAKADKHAKRPLLRSSTSGTSSNCVDCSRRCVRRRSTSSSSVGCASRTRRSATRWT